MLKNTNIICISSIDWDSVWQGHQEIMSALANNGNKVLFIENTGARTPSIRDFSRLKKRVRNWFKGIRGIRREMDNLYIFSPILLPFPYSRIAGFINRRLILPILEKWMKVTDFSDPVIWVFLPTPMSLDIIDNITNKSVVYYCIDNFSVSSSSAKKIVRSENKLIKRVDLVFVTSAALYKRCVKYNSNVHLFPFGVNFKEFERARLGAKQPPRELNGMKKPVVGYIGGVHKWIDLGLIKDIAAGNPDSSFVFIGPLYIDASSLHNIKNIHFLGGKPHDEIPDYVKNFDVAIIPYLDTEYTRNVYPTKLNEYLAMGKPVVSTALPELIKFNMEYPGSVYIGNDYQAFEKCVRTAVEKDSPALRNKRIEIARTNSWDMRIEKMCRLIESDIDRKKSGMEARWRQDLLSLYRVARRKMIKAVVAVGLLYLLLFKTAFVWFAAGPLEISDQPQRVDAIVVFGGGVGETGRADSSSIERARYAAELYSQGFAGKIIFSSGYIHTYNDADSMRLIALSMGVKKSDTELEQNASSTYENVVFSKELLDKEKIRSVLLVSSPYNMRRAALVFKKYGGGVKVFYTPVPHSAFYSRATGVRMEHISAIMHEYLGIVYYWFKGYI